MNSAAGTMNVCECVWGECVCVCLCVWVCVCVCVFGFSIGVWLKYDRYFLLKSFSLVGQHFPDLLSRKIRLSLELILSVPVGGSRLDVSGY